MRLCDWSWWKRDRKWTINLGLDRQEYAKYKIYHSTVMLLSSNLATFGAQFGKVKLKKRSVSCLYLFISVWVFLHEHSRYTGLQGKGDTISSTILYHFLPLHRHLDSGWLLQIAHLCPWVEAVLKPGIFGFRWQVANHEAAATCPVTVLLLNRDSIRCECKIR